MLLKGHSPFILDFGIIGHTNIYELDVSTKLQSLAFS